MSSGSIYMMYRTIVLRSVVAILFLCLVITVSCYRHRIDVRHEFNQGVTGTVWLKSGYDGEDAQYAVDPPDLSLQPLAGATLYLLRYSSNNLNSQEIVVTTQSDSLGRFRLIALPGTYYLAVYMATVSTSVISYMLGDTIGLDFSINAFTVVRIPNGRFIEESFEIAELLPQ